MSFESYSASLGLGIGLKWIPDLQIWTERSFPAWKTLRTTCWYPDPIFTSSWRASTSSRRRLSRSDQFQRSQTLPWSLLGLPWRLGTVVYAPIVSFEGIRFESRRSDRWQGDELWSSSGLKNEWIKTTILQLIYHTSHSLKKDLPSKSGYICRIYVWYIQYISQLTLI